MRPLRSNSRRTSMATISDATLDIQNVDDTTVKVTVSYNLTPDETAEFRVNRPEIRR